ncbi:MAG: glycosyltransferase family 4 protein [Gammaproteobacteria bacterium]|nr:glycosyltransferase family 4 protein [Gammaproteobacteria bacterium]MCF6230080.1 glycosyltransferase family 4 protein [Gammaproteobacteria bacterium]
MKVLLAHNNYTITGGAEVFYRGVGRVLEKNGHEVAYFSCQEGGLDTQWADYFPKSVDYQSGGFAQKIQAFPAMVYSKKSKQAMARLIEDFKPDIIHAFAIYVKLTPSILDAAREAGIPVVMSCNDYKHICPSYKLYHRGKICEECKGGKFYRAVVNRCAHDSMVYSVASGIEAYVHNYLNIYRKNIHTFLFSSEFMAHKTEEFWGKDTFRWRKLRNPFDSTKYQATYTPKGSVLFFGRIIDEKGVDILVQAAAQLPQVSFRLVGDGPDLSSLKEMAENLGVKNIVFTGAKWGEEMDEELKQCAFVVVPSIWHENFPYVINQSFAFGKPVVGSNRGGITELVAHGERGLIYKATDSAALAQTVRELWNDSQRIKTMGQRAKEFSDREFNDQSLYQTLHGIYTEVLS